MDKYQWLRKCFSVGIILLFIGTVIIPSNAKPIISTANIEPRPGNFFGLKSNIEISWDANDTKEPLIPRGYIHSVNMTVSFWVTWGIFSRLINYLFKNRLLLVKLSIVDTPEWCTAVLMMDTLRFNMPQKENTPVIVTARFAIQAADGAPAFEVCPITIQATMESVHGFFGLLTLMKGTTQVVNITFTVAYKPQLSIDFPEGTIIETHPLVQVELPIGITNLGNGKTTVINEIVNYPSDWIVTLPSQVTLETSEYKEINLTIIAPSKFSGEKEITMSFTPHSYDNHSLIGATTNETILVYYNPP
jgi:hypothetical protein